MLHRSWQAAVGDAVAASSVLLLQPPMFVDVAPPKWARPAYKLVAIVDGFPTSVYDGVTCFPMGQTVHQVGGSAAICSPHADMEAPF